MAYSNLDESLGKRTGMQDSQRSEGRLTHAIEKETAKAPSGFYLSLAVASILISFGLQALGKKNQSNFVGLWVPSLLILGLYNKLVKLEGSDPHSH